LIYTKAQARSAIIKKDRKIGLNNMFVFIIKSFKKNVFGQQKATQTIKKHKKYKNIKRGMPAISGNDDDGVDEPSRRNYVKK
jgi:hypothetical protein